MSRCTYYYTCVRHIIHGDRACDNCIGSILEDDCDCPECLQRRVEAAKNYLDKLKNNPPGDGMMFVDYFEDDHD